MDDTFSTSSIKHEKQVSSWASFPEDGMSVVHTGLFYHRIRFQSFFTNSTKEGCIHYIKNITMN